MNTNDFGKKWVQDWNSHDLEAIMTHYSEHIDFTSPFIKQMGIDAEGKITNKSQLKQYFSKALEKYPDLHFDLHYELWGLRSVVLFYTSVNDLLSAEFMELDEEHKVICVKAHYHS